MKYFSILKDSFREALDSKILYVTFGLSFVLMFLVGSASFRPLSAREQVETPLWPLNWTWKTQAGQLNKEPIHAEVVDFKQTNAGEEPWQGNREFTVVIHVPDGGTAPKEVHLVPYFCLINMWWTKDAQFRDPSGPLQSPLQWTKDGREGRFTIIARGSRIVDERGWFHAPSLLFGAVDLSWFVSSLNYAVYWIENWLINKVGAWVIVLLGIIATASFLPSMMRKGTIDLLLAKPVTRAGLLIFKYVGGLTFLFLNTVVAIGGVWLMLGLRTGVWTWSFPATILSLTFFFAILYSFSTLVAVTTRSTVVCILLTLLLWAGLFAVNFTYDRFHPAPTTRNAIILKDSGVSMQESSVFEPPPLVGGTVDTLHALLPRTGDLGDLNTRLISDELLSEAERQQRDFEAIPKVNWLESLGVSLGFIVLVLGFACWRFARKDF